MLFIPQTSGQIYDTWRINEGDQYPYEAKSLAEPLKHQSKKTKFQLTRKQSTVYGKYSSDFLIRRRTSSTFDNTNDPHTLFLIEHIKSLPVRFFTKPACQHESLQRKMRIYLPNQSDPNKST